LKLGKFLKEGTLVLRDTELWRVRSIATSMESLLMSLSSSYLQYLQPFSGVWRPDLVGPKFLGEFPAREGCNLARAANYRTKGKEIDLSDLACSCWDFKRDLSLSIVIVSWRYSQPHTLFFHLYSRSVHLLY
jgi:hypothetical protein